jgi:hypothetical protein
MFVYVEANFKIAPRMEILWHYIFTNTDHATCLIVKIFQLYVSITSELRLPYLEKRRPPPPSPEDYSAIPRRNWRPLMITRICKYDVYIFCWPNDTQLHKSTVMHVDRGRIWKLEKGPNLVRPEVKKRFSGSGTEFNRRADKLTVKAVFKGIVSRDWGQVHWIISYRSEEFRVTGAYF